ncbi:hypothetical protein SAMN05192550_3161 [Flavobacterium glycines]|uniref:DUF5777 domain-containing protein n=1 Tax=Flavobacterium glycines TaxID=551990 RepID=A0A1B9DX06_9FLAO|nr:DUF5777 family beta-barrel protein [Flavobacterium glycines]OCB74222.1 hypothetical protein FBGL_02110 [Flavobacterium glycines]GEL12268.1 hypothetical protein FGL01_30070 [Flavobacterium glycines]SDK01047.1 hypothetical protein SAMN05192550_3161 [Flavobacterium glycines]
MKIKYTFLAFFFPLLLLAQNDLLKEIDDKSMESTANPAFKALKIVNFESTKLIGKGDFYLIISHRFDYLDQGIKEFFGLDNAFTQLKFAYGITDKFTIQAARSGFQKTYDLGLKYLIINQKTNGSPVAIAFFNSLAANTELDKANYPSLDFQDRLSYVSQLLISRKITDKLSLEVAPTFFHEGFLVEILDENNNVVTPNPQDKNQFAVGIGGRYKLSKRLSLNMDYGAHLNRASQSVFKNPLSVGLDIDTGGHIFQVLFTNSKAMHEAGFLGHTTGDWGKGEISFGFNLIRVF